MEKPKKHIRKVNTVIGALISINDIEKYQSGISVPIKLSSTSSQAHLNKVIERLKCFKNNALARERGAACEAGTYDHAIALVQQELDAIIAAAATKEVKK